MSTNRFARIAGRATILALAFTVLVGGSSHSLAQVEVRPGFSPSVQQCTNQWSSSQASSHCSNPTISVNDTNCDLDGSCSISATVTQADGTDVTTTWTPSLNLTLALNKVSGIDICFKLNSDSTAFTASVKAQCAEGESNTNAAANGLSLPSSLRAD